MELFRRKTLIINIGISLLVLLLIGSCFDEQISTLLYHPQNSIGVLLASYGQLPAMLCCASGGILMITIADKKKKASAMGCWIGGVLLNLLAVMGITMDPMLYIEGMSVWLSLMIALLFVAAADILILKLSKGADRKQIKYFIIIVVGTMFLEMILINLIKIPWGRPRMRMIAVQPKASFQPWWVIGSEMKDSLMAIGVAAEEFKSFPSGHSGNAACALLLSVLPLICTRLKGKETTLMVFGILFTLIVAGSRIVMGAHFLSDVTVGMGITFFVETLLIHKISKTMQKQIN